MYQFEMKHAWGGTNAAKIRSSMISFKSSQHVLLTSCCHGFCFVICDVFRQSGFARLFGREVSSPFGKVPVSLQVLAARVFF